MLIKMGIARICPVQAGQIGSCDYIRGSVVAIGGLDGPGQVAQAR